MKLNHLFFLLLCIFAISCDDDDYPFAEVPSVVLNQFWTEYPDASDIEFDKSGEAYEVEFEIDDRDYKALIATSGRVVGEKKEINVDLLPAEVRQTLHSEYGENDIKDVEQVRMGEDIYYQAEIRRFLFNKNIVLNEAGKKDANLDYWK